MVPADAGACTVRVGLATAGERAGTADAPPVHETARGALMTKAFLAALGLHWLWQWMKRAFERCRHEQ